MTMQVGAPYAWAEVDGERPVPPQGAKVSIERLWLIGMALMVLLGVLSYVLA